MSTEQEPINEQALDLSEAVTAFHMMRDSLPAQEQENLRLKGYALLNSTEEESETTTNDKMM